jgi:hypothetical protein
MAIKEINDKTLVEVYSNSRGGVGYTIHNGQLQGIRRNWERAGQMQEVEFKELRLALFEHGIYKLFQRHDGDIDKETPGDLLIKDARVRERLNLCPLDEYSLDNEQIKDLVKNATLDKFEDVLANCPSSVLERIIAVGVEMKLSDLNKINAIKAYTGTDISMVVEIDNTQTNQNKKGRPKKGV